MLKKNVDNNNNEKYLYSSILSQDCLNAIQNYFIPDNHNARNLKIRNSIIYRKKCKKIKEILDVMFVVVVIIIL